MNYTGNTTDLPALFGLRVITRPIPHRMVQAKTHRRRRINKKWLKRYGYKSVVAPYDRFEVLMMGPNVYAFPEGIEAIKKALDKSNQEALQRSEERMLTGVAKSVAPEPSGILQKPITKADILSAMDAVMEQLPELKSPDKRRFGPWGILPIVPFKPIKPSVSD